MSVRRLRNRVARALLVLANYIGDIGQAIAVCPTCGRNPYTGEPCHGIPPTDR